MRVLVVTNLMPDASAPQRGRWIQDQIEEIRSAGVEVELFGFPPGRGSYIPATRRLRRLLRDQSFDLVHAHYGLAGWCARLAGASPLVVSFHGTDVRHHLVGPMSRRLAWRADLVAAVSRALFFPEQGRPGLPDVPGSAVLPCGPDLGRFHPIPRQRGEARAGPRPRRPPAALPGQPGPAREARRSRPRARRGSRRRAPHRRLDRPRADAALDQRRERGARHLRQRGLRDDLRRGPGLRRPGPLDPGRDRPLRARRGARHPLRPVRGRSLARAPARPTSTQPTPGSMARAGRPRCRRRGWPSGRSSPTARCWATRNRLKP